MDIYDVYNDTLRSTTEQIIELYHEFLKSGGREGTPLDRLDFLGRPIFTYCRYHRLQYTIGNRSPSNCGGANV